MGENAQMLENRERVRRWRYIIYAWTQLASCGDREVEFEAIAWLRYIRGHLQEEFERRQK